jgi:CBS-domain-containing membrane protein
MLAQMMTPEIREIILAEPQSQISDIMDNRFTSLKATDDQETAVQVFQEYDRIALPVTDTRGVLLGIVTFDDAMDVAEEEDDWFEWRSAIRILIDWEKAYQELHINKSLV